MAALRANDQALQALAQKLGLDSEEIKEEIRDLREEVVEKLDSQGDTNNPHTPETVDSLQAAVNMLLSRITADITSVRAKLDIEEKHKRAAADALRSLGFKYTLKRIGGFRIWVWVSSDHRHLGGKKSSEKPEAKNDEGLNPSDDATQEQG